jgi:hypothetical protein
MEKARPFKMLVTIYQSTWHYIENTSTFINTDPRTSNLAKHTSNQIFKNCKN